MLTPTLYDFHEIRDKEGDIQRFEEIKRRESQAHFQKVELADKPLVVNYNKDGKENYIGGNTFAEIAYAIALKMCHGKILMFIQLTHCQMTLLFLKSYMHGVFIRFQNCLNIDWFK